MRIIGPPAPHGRGSRAGDGRRARARGRGAGSAGPRACHRRRCRRGSGRSGRASRAAAPGAPSADRPRGRPARVSAQPSASAERTLGASAQAARASVNARAAIAVVGLEQRELHVAVHARLGEQRPLGVDQREVAPARGATAGRQLGLAELDRVLRQREQRRDLLPAGDRAGEVAAGGGQARPPGERGDVVRHGGERRAVCAARLGEPAAGELEVAQQRLHVGEVLARAAAGRDGARHRVGGPGEVAVQLAEVRHAGVRRQRGLAVDQLLERPLGLVVAAELDERVDQDRERGDRVRRERAGAFGELQRAGEVVAAGGERGRGRPARPDRRARAPARGSARRRRARRSWGRRSREPSGGTRRRAAPRAARRRVRRPGGGRSRRRCWRPGGRRRRRWWAPQGAARARRRAAA